MEVSASLRRFGILMMLRIFKLFGVALWLASVALPASAADGQFYMIGKYGTAGSMTAPGQTQPAVYLRWDVVEGQFPQDMAGFRLLRDGQVLGDSLMPVDGLMSVSEIEALYTGPAQQRRKLELVNRMSEYAAGESRNFAAGNFAAELHGLLDATNPRPPQGSGIYSQAWAFLGPRTDINIAAARYRGFVDTNLPAASSVTYELLAVSTDLMTTSRLGLVTIDLTAPAQLLGVDRFEQVSLVPDECDMPDASKDHFTVALDWDSPGYANVSDRIATQLYVSGMDLYRTTENLDASIVDPPLRDIAAEAAAAGSNERGDPVLDGLEKVNLPLISASGPFGVEEKWLEARDKLKRAGLKPGDRRVYYLVPRDFSGSYGPTSAAIVVVSDTNRPPTPWNVRARPDDLVALPDETEVGTFSLSWDAVSASSYGAYYSNSVEFCSLPDSNSPVVEFVVKGGNCLTDARTRVRTDVSEYLVYRFATIDDAELFKDSDGDGYADADERPLGTQCEFNDKVDGLTNFLVTSDENQWSTAKADFSTEVIPPNDREVFKFRDSAPADVPGNVFWYRIASKTPDGKLSFVSAPERGMFPDKTLPDQPTVSVTRKGPGEVVSGCEFQDQSNAPPGFRFVDQLDPDGLQAFGVLCSDIAGGTKFLSFKGSMTQGETIEQCRIYRQDCENTTVTLLYPPTVGNGRRSCTSTLKKNEICGEGELPGYGQINIVPLYEQGEVDIPVEPGSSLAGTMVITVNTLQPDVCLSLSQRMFRGYSKVASNCGEAPSNELVYEVPAGFFCGYAVAQDRNNNVSAVQHIPCTSLTSDNVAPSPPQVVSLEVTSDQSLFSYRLPPEPVAVVVARLTHQKADGSEEWTVEAIPVADVGNGSVLNFQLPAELLAGSKDRFCLKMLSIGPRLGNAPSKSSPYGAERCYVRRSDGEDNPDFMPWPHVSGPQQSDDLTAAVISEYRNIRNFSAIELAANLDLVQLCIDPNAGTPASNPSEFERIICNAAGQAKVNSQALPDDSFVVYRQSNYPERGIGDWVQVSPLIEYAHWTFEPSKDSSSLTAFSFALQDPYIKLLSNGGNRYDLMFVDRYPNSIGTPGYSYRYQIVYFDAEHKPVSWRQSAWVGQQ